MLTVWNVHNFVAFVSGRIDRWFDNNRVFRDLCVRWKQGFSYGQSMSSIGSDRMQWVEQDEDVVYHSCDLFQGWILFRLSFKVNLQSRIHRSFQSASRTIYATYAKPLKPIGMEQITCHQDIYTSAAYLSKISYVRFCNLIFIALYSLSCRYSKVRFTIAILWLVFRHADSLNLTYTKNIPGWWLRIDPPMEYSRWIF
jgi:hypothetical protein